LPLFFDTKIACIFGQKTDTKMASIFGQKTDTKIASIFGTTKIASIF
jgi:hypothetical protein